MYNNFMKDKDINFIAIDLDDTLLNEDNRITARTAKAIRQAKDLGIFIVIATGRMFATAQPVGKTLQLGDVPMILYSGGTVQRAQSGKIISEHAIPLDTAREILALCRENDWYVQAYADDELLIKKRNERTDLYEECTGAVARELGVAFYDLQKAPVKLLIIDEKETLEHISQIINKFYGDIVQAVRSKDTYLEIIAKNVSKGSAVLEIANRLGITHDQIMAFGNAQNDISMLQEAGVAVAMGNADPRLKAMADIVAPSNANDGVAAIIEEYILKK